MRAFAAVFLMLPLCPVASQAQAWQSYTNINPVRQLAAEGRLLWAATEGGVFSFSTADTTLKRVYTNVDGLPSTDVTCAAAGSHGRLYFGTAGSGLAVLDSSRTGFTVINSRDHNIISDSINAVLCHGDYVFLGSPGGLSFFDGQAWRSFSNRIYPMGPNVLSLAWRNDSLFVGCAGSDSSLSVSPLGGLTGPNYSLWRRYSNAGAGDPSVLCLTATDTAILAGTGRGLSRFSNGTWLELLNLGSQVRHICRNNDTMYLATSNGVREYFSGTLLNISAGLPSLDVKTLYITSDSAIWAGTADGLARWDGSSWRPFPQNCIPSNSVILAAAGPDGAIWLAHGGEFASRIRPDGAVVRFQHPVSGIPVASLSVDPSGRAWYGLSYWDGAGKSYVVRIGPDDSLEVISSPPLPPRLGIYDIFVDPLGYCYLAGHGNVATNYVVEFSPGDSVRWISDSTLPVQYLKPTSVAKDGSGNLWMGTYDFRFACYDMGRNAWHYFGQEDGLSTIQFWDIAIEPSGLMWLASRLGLNRCRFDPVGQRLEEVSVYQTANSSVLGDDVRSVALDRSGNRWIATDRGLSLFSWDGKWTGFTSSDAFANGSKLLCDDVRHVAVRPGDASGDDILMATPRGLSIYRHSFAAPGQEASAHVAPNPFRPARDRVLMFSNLPDRSTVSLHALDGRLLASWAGPAAPAHILYVSPASLPGGLPSGLYLCVVRSTSAKSQVIKLAVIR
jgi:ligand-binding sensor domain-containing protein